MIEWKVGDVIRIKRAFDFDAVGTDVNVKIAIGVGQTFTVTDVSGDSLIVELNVSGVFDATITTTWSIALIDEDAIEFLRPLEEEPPVDPPTGGGPMEYQRYSAATIRKTTKRPEVFLYQGALKSIDAYDGSVDGWYGAGSETAVKEFQTKNSLAPVDGVIGKGTATEVITQATSFVPDLNYRIMSVIAYYEVGNRQDAFGMAENDIGDNAGANYGIFQCNSLGSCAYMLRLGGRDDLAAVYNSTDKAVVNPTIKDWFGSAEGIQTQVKYFEENTLTGAMRELREFALFDAWENDDAKKTWWERAVLLFCDSRIQNGTMWSGSRRPFWKDLEGADGRPASQNIPELFYGTWWDEVLGRYIKYEDFKTMWWAEFAPQNQDIKKTTLQVCKDLVSNTIPASDPSAQLMLLAQTRSRSSAPTWWYQAVSSRRVTDATGTSESHPSGVVNGAKLKLLEDYAL